MDQRYYYLVTPLAYTGTATGFTYHADVPLAVGQLVQIPLGQRNTHGVLQNETSKPQFATKPLTPLPLPPVPTDLCNLAEWLANYYAASPSSVWSTILPSGLAKQRRPIATKPPPTAQGLPTNPLTREQATVLRQIRLSAHHSFLIQGVTGSGKTRLYLELAAEALGAGQSVIVLVPEITLTPQIVAQFEAAFGNQVLSSHSKLTEAGRHRIWLEALEAAIAKQPRIIIGPRSCLFMPVHQLGLVVVDECHETTYKQEQHPRYHAVATAARRASLHEARLVLGSATPSLGELFLAQAGRLEHLSLTQRANNIPHPQGKIIDLRDKELFKLSKFITQPLIEAIQSTMDAKRQTLLYINRRGSASSQLCGDCGQVTTCPHCELPLTFHADLMRLICHHCNFRRANPAVCSKCGGANLRLLGGGTKRIEAEIGLLFPSARVARLDRDSATLSHIQTVLRQLRQGQLDILIGTQMIAKGLDLPAIDTVGIINADTMLHLPDFTAAERTYQLISQVSGRTGRGDRAGQVFIQTHTPDHPAIQAAARHTYEDFAKAELGQRRLLHYPPFVYLLQLTISLATQTTTMAEANRFCAELQLRPGLQVTGPAPSFIELQGNKYHWVVTVRSKHRLPLVKVAQELPNNHWIADLDPVNLL